MFGFLKCRKKIEALAREATKIQNQIYKDLLTQKLCEDCGDSVGLTFKHYHIKNSSFIVCVHVDKSCYEIMDEKGNRIALVWRTCIAPEFFSYKLIYALVNGEVSIEDAILIKHGAKKYE